MFTGTWAPEAGSAPVQWQYGRATEDILGWDWAELAPTLAALGSPVRLGLLHQILTGTQDTAALTAAEGLGTSGQVHHHLRILVAAWDPAAGGNYRAEFLDLPPEEALGKVLTGMGSLSGAELMGERMTVPFSTQDQEEEVNCFSDTSVAAFLGDQDGIGRRGAAVLDMAGGAGLGVECGAEAVATRSGRRRAHPVDVEEALAEGEVPPGGGGQVGRRQTKGVAPAVGHRRGAAHGHGPPRPAGRRHDGCLLYTSDAADE